MIPLAVLFFSHLLLCLLLCPRWHLSDETTSGARSRLELAMMQVRYFRTYMRMSEVTTAPLYRIWHYQSFSISSFLSVLSCIFGGRLVQTRDNRASVVPLINASAVQCASSTHYAASTRSGSAPYRHHLAEVGKHRI